MSDKRSESHPNLFSFAKRSKVDLANEIVDEIVDVQQITNNENDDNRNSFF